MLFQFAALTPTPTLPSSKGQIRNVQPHPRNRTARVALHRLERRGVLWNSKLYRQRTGSLHLALTARTKARNSPRKARRRYEYRPFFQRALCKTRYPHHPKFETYPTPTRDDNRLLRSVRRAAIMPRTANLNPASRPRPSPAKSRVRSPGRRYRLHLDDGNGELANATANAE